MNGLKINGSIISSGGGVYARDAGRLEDLEPEMPHELPRMVDYMSVYRAILKFLPRKKVDLRLVPGE